MIILSRRIKKVNLQISDNLLEYKKMEQIDFEEFKKIEIRIGKIISAEKIENTEKLLKLQIDLGDSQKIAVAGIANYYRPEELLNKKVAVVVNLKPAKFRGITSEVMILAADSGDDIAILTVDRDIPSGSKVR